MNETTTSLLDRIASYFGNGGLFNPEYMEHDKVRDLILDVRNYIEYTERERTRLLGDRARYITTFKHRHMAGKYGDLDCCVECGLDLRDPIHARLSD